jgi:integrase
MPKPRKYEQVRCTHFVWRLVDRNGQWYADGRSNTPNAGRHSLGTNDKDEALRLLPELDRVRAEDLGLIPRSAESSTRGPSLPMGEGRALYEKHIARPRVTGGVRKSTQKRYRTVFDKFIPFATARGVTVWNGVTAELLTAYAAHLENQGYAHKTLVNELTTLKQTVRWMIRQGHLQGMKPIELRVQKAESEPAYCYRPREVKAMVEYCRARTSLKWLGDVIIALACTGLRIAELCSLRWSDLDLQNERLKLTDETGRAIKSDRKRRQLKSGRSRTFPIHRELMAVLKGLLRRDGDVFRGPRGGRLKPDTVRRILVREVIQPLAEKFPTPEGEKGFAQGRLHSFRHYFCSTCANSGVPERMVMDWLGHADSEMIRLYYHLHDEEAKRRMDGLDFLGGAGGRSVGDNEGQRKEEDVEPPSSETSDNG